MKTLIIYDMDIKFLETFKADPWTLCHDNDEPVSLLSRT